MKKITIETITSQSTGLKRTHRATEEKTTYTLSFVINSERHTHQLHVRQVVVAGRESLFLSADNEMLQKWSESDPVQIKLRKLVREINGGKKLKFPLSLDLDD